MKERNYRKANFDNHERGQYKANEKAINKTHRKKQHEQQQKTKTMGNIEKTSLLIQPNNQKKFQKI